MAATFVDFLYQMVFIARHLALRHCGSATLRYNSLLLYLCLFRLLRVHQDSNLDHRGNRKRPKIC